MACYPPLWVSFNARCGLCFITTNNMKRKKLKSKWYSVWLCVFDDYKEMYNRVDTHREKIDDHTHNYKAIFLGQWWYHIIDWEQVDTKHLWYICIPEKHLTMWVISHEVFHAVMELKHRYEIDSKPWTDSNELLAWIMWDFMRQIYLFYIKIKNLKCTTSDKKEEVSKND